MRYKDAGVDIDAAATLVEAIKPLARGTDRPVALGGIGGFGALFDLAAAGYKNPLLVATTDGVGTKLKVALAAGRHDKVGIDLVAMCVNDLVVQGAEPLFFLDYFATGRLDAARGATIVAGIAEGCRAAGCALIGGETAEMPGMYQGEDYDLAGFAVGAVERAKVLTGAKICDGDVVLGLASSGLHSNGFSLVRHVVEARGLDYAAPAPFAPVPLGEALIEPTRIYVKSCLAAHRAGLIRGFVHITGGGFYENIPRVLPEALAVEIDARRWAVPAVFRWLGMAGGIAPAEMLRTFNCGIGMIAIVAPENAWAAQSALSSAGETVTAIGTVVKRAPAGDAVVIDHLEAAWAG